MTPHILFHALGRDVHSTDRTRRPVVRHLHSGPLPPISSPDCTDSRPQYVSIFYSSFPERRFMPRPNRFVHWIQPRSWNLILSCSAIASAVALALPSSLFLPLASP